MIKLNKENNIVKLKKYVYVVENIHYHINQNILKQNNIKIL